VRHLTCCTPPEPTGRVSLQHPDEMPNPICRVQLNDGKGSDPVFGFLLPNDPEGSDPVFGFFLPSTQPTTKQNASMARPKGAEYPDAILPVAPTGTPGSARLGGIRLPPAYRGAKPGLGRVAGAGLKRLHAIRASRTVRPPPATDGAEADSPRPASLELSAPPLPRGPVDAPATAENRKPGLTPARR